jgi:hypothetical protein
MNPALTAFVSIHGTNCILSLSKIKQVEMRKFWEITHEFRAPKFCEKIISSLNKPYVSGERSTLY